MEADRPEATPLPAATTAVVPVRANAHLANRSRASLVRPGLCRSLPAEPVSHAEHRQQVAWIVRIRLDLAAQILDVRVDRKSTRLNSSHGYISYAVFRLKKKNTLQHR